MNAEDPCAVCQGSGRSYRNTSPQLTERIRCEACEGTGAHEGRLCEVDRQLGRGCQRRALPDRKICKFHAFPAAREKGTTGRRAAIEATKRKIALQETQVSAGSAEEDLNG